MSSAKKTPHEVVPVKLSSALSGEVQPDRRRDFGAIAYGQPATQHARRDDPFIIHRSNWWFGESVDSNIANLEIDGQLFARVTGRSAVG